MTNALTFLCIGNSNMDGIARLADVPAGDFRRWTGVSPPGQTVPYEATVPKVRAFTPRLPYAAGEVREIAAAGPSSITVSGQPLPVKNIDSWLHVRTNSLGQGQHRRIVGGAGTNTITVAPDWSPEIASDGTVELLAESHTLAGIQTSRILTKTAATPPFDASHVGRWVVAISGGSISEARKITAVTATTLTVDNEWGQVPQPGDGIRIMTGARAADSIVTYRSSGSVRDLAFFYDNAATYSTGFEYPNFKALPPSGPRLHLQNQLINCIPELASQLREVLGDQIHVLPLGISACTLSPLPIGTALQVHAYSWTHDITHLDFHPTSPSGLYGTLLDALRSMAAVLAREGRSIDVRGVFCTLAENDAGGRASAEMFGSNMALLRDSLRTWLGAQRFTSFAAPQIPWVMSGINAGVFPFGAKVMESLEQIVREDPRSGLVATDRFHFEADQVHLDARGMIQLGRAFSDAWVRIVGREAGHLA